MQPPRGRFERPRTERLLRESEARFRATFELAAVGIAHVGLDGRWLRVNDRLCAISGYSRDELLAGTFQQITHSADLAADLDAGRRLTSGEAPTYSVEKRYIRRDGSMIWVHATVTLVRDEAGEPSYYISVIEDISQRKAAELALREHQARLQLALDAAELGTWDYDVESREVIASERYRAILGAPSDLPLTQDSILAQFHPDDQARSREAIAVAVAARSVYTNEYRLRRPDGTVRWIASTGLPIFVNDELNRVVGVAMDVTARRDEEARQRFLVELYERLNRIDQPDELVATVAGELAPFFGLSRVLFLARDAASGVWQALVDHAAAADAGPFPIAALLHAAGGVLEANQTVAIHAVRDDERCVEVADAFERAAIGSLLALPLQTDGRLAAALVAADVTWRAWRPEKVALLRSVADHLWLALENRRLYRDAVGALHERDRTLAALLASEAHFRELTEALPQLVFTSDMQGHCTYLNHRWVEYTGRSLEESLGLGWTAAFHPDDQSAASEGWEDALNVGETRERETRILGADGVYRWFLSRIVPIRDVDGRIVQWFGSSTDIDERRRALATVKESEARLRRLFDANVFGVIFWSEGGAITQANDAFLALIGATRVELEQGEIDWRAITPPEWREADEHAYAEIRATGSCMPYEKAYRRRDGSDVPVLHASTIFPGTTDGIGLVFDLTERKQQERFEQELLAGIAHDIKNPLAAMKAQAQLMRRRLRDGRLAPEIAQEGLLAIDGNVTRVSNRLDELMDTALMRAGHELDLSREPVDLVALTTARAETYRQTTERHQIVVLARDKPLIGAWDANRIERVIDNLLANAIKYSPIGGVVQVELRREEVWAVMTIADEGVGIPPADLPHIFTRFARGSNVQGLMHGTGIGLAGVRMLIEQHGGSVEAESVEGEGSTFTVRLPLIW